MKKFLILIIFITSLFSNTSYAGYRGEGPVKLEDYMVNAYINWLRGGWGKKPMVFY